MLKIPAEYDKNTSPAKLTDISCKVFPSSVLGISVDICQRALVDESRMIRNQMGTHIRSLAAVNGTLYTVPPYKCNQ
jgi:hypothetical protein